MTQASEHDEDETQDEKTWKEFNDAVNMTPSELRKHLDSDESKSVGQKKNGSDESQGHKEGRKILAIKDKKKADLTKGDFADMRKVVSYVHRHLAQGGSSRDDPESAWRLSLMNWGHDPIKS